MPDSYPQQAWAWAQKQYQWARGQGQNARNIGQGALGSWPVQGLGLLGRGALGTASIPFHIGAGIGYPVASGLVGGVGSLAAGVGLGAAQWGVGAATAVAGTGAWLYNWGRASVAKELRGGGGRPYASLIRRYTTRHGQEWLLNRKLQWGAGIAGFGAMAALSYFNMSYPINAKVPGIGRVGNAVTMGQVDVRSKHLGVSATGAINDSNGAGADLNFAAYNTYRRGNLG